MSKTAIFPSFRRNEPKSTKPLTMRNAEGWFEYPCCECGGIAQRRKRKRCALMCPECVAKLTKLAV